jgi:hypothetical protein
VTGDREGAMAERRHHLDLVQRQRAFRSRALAWPAINPPSSPTSAGVVQPHSLMLAAIAATWASV